MYTALLDRSTGRKCDHYANILTPTDQHIGAEVFTPRCENEFVIRTKVETITRHNLQQETRALEYSYRKPLPALCGLIKTDVWTRLVLQLSNAKPTIKAAVSALSLFHELCEKRDHERMFTWQTNEDALALEQYHRAIDQLRTRLAAGESTCKTFILASCLIFTSLELICGGRTAALTYLKSGMGILRLQSCDGRGCPETSALDKSLARVFSRLCISFVYNVWSTPKQQVHGSI